MAYDITFDRYLDIDGVPIQTPAWQLLNFEKLLGGPAVRGSNRIIPGSPGVRPKRRRATEKTLSLEVFIDGAFDWEGDPHSDPETGLIANIQYLREHVTDPISGDSVRLATAYIKDEFVMTADIQVVSFDIGEHVGTSAVNATIDIALLDGAFTIEAAS